MCINVILVLYLWKFHSLLFSYWWGGGGGGGGGG